MKRTNTPSFLALALVAFCSSLFLATGISAKPTSPQQASKTLKSNLGKSRASSVSLSAAGGAASAVVISPDGLVLSAAHIFQGKKNDKPVKLTFPDGTQAEAKLLGYNVQTDFALLKITTKSKNPWPHCELAKTAPKMGEYCYTLAHPAGQIKNRPAQLRIGRIISHGKLRGKANLISADCNIQPGDSGGPLFSLDGKLIGINSTAASVIGFNLFPAIDQYHLDKAKLLRGKQWGDVKLSPANPDSYKVTMDKKTVAKLQAEFMRRVKAKHPATMAFIRTKKVTNGELKLTAQEMASHLPQESILFAKGQEVGLGLDDPAITSQLPKPPKAQQLIISGNKVVGRGFAVSKQYIVAKMSMLKDVKQPLLYHEKKGYPMQMVAKVDSWDLALYQIKTRLPLDIIDWEKTKINVAPGDVLVAQRASGQTVWNVAADARRPITKKISLGPISNQNIISKQRAPYPRAISTGMELFAQDAGTLIYDANGKFVGMYQARLSRSLGYIVSASDLKMISEKMLAAQKAKKQPAKK